MKKFFLLFLIVFVLCVTFSGCNSSEDHTNDRSNKYDDYSDIPDQYDRLKSVVEGENTTIEPSSPQSSTNYSGNDYTNSALIANSATQKQFEDNIEKIDNDILILEQKRDEAQKKDNKEKQGYTYVYGTIKCNNPLVINYGLTDSNTYIWVKDTTYFADLMVLAEGYVEFTGNYNTWNGITCAECNSVSVNLEYEKQVQEYEKEINEKKKQKGEYTSAINAVISPLYDENLNYYVTKGDQFIPEYYVSESKYNKLIWSSDDESVAQVDQNGSIKAVGYGSTNIHVQTSISGSNLTFSVKVCKPVEELIMEDELFIDFSMYENKIYQIPCKTTPSDANIYVEWKDSIGENIVQLELQNSLVDTIAVKVLNRGVGYMNIYDYKDNLIKSIRIIIDIPLTKLEFGKDKYETETGIWLKVKLKTKPKDSYEKIKLEYNSGILKVDHIEGEDIYHIILRDQVVTELKAISSSGKEASCLIGTPRAYSNSDYDFTINNGTKDNYIIPDSDQRYLTEDDVDSLSNEQLRIARNEIYARYGRLFKSEDLQTYFNECSWYEPLDSWEFDDSWLTDIERANIVFLKEVEESRYSGDSEPRDEDYGDSVLDEESEDMEGFYKDSGDGYWEDEYDDWIISYSSRVYLTYSDVMYLSKEEIRLARNEIYARHGRTFSADDLKKYFNNRSWYIPIYSADEFDDSWLSDIERANINFLKEVEDSR